MTQAKTNKVNFYLIKPDTAIQGIFKDPVESLDSHEMRPGFTLYYNRKATIQSPWVKDFFKTELVDEDGRHIFNAASSQAVLLRTINIRGQQITFAICFGTGFHMLQREAYEPRFGLLTVLNVVGENSLRKIDKHDISGTPKFTAEQLSKKGGQIDFTLDFELDILLGVTGTLDKDLKEERTLQKLFGTTITGKSNLNVSAKFNIDNVDRLLRASYIASNIERYKDKGFAWIDKIELVKKNTRKYENLISKLNERLLDVNGSSKLWMSIPELVEWQDITGFYFENDASRLYGDVSMKALREVITEELSVTKLHSIKVNALHSNGTRNAHEWTAYQCLYAEVELENESYVLINSEWYKLKGDFVTETNDKYQEILLNHPPQISFRDYEHTDGNENGYNKNLSLSIANSVCLDAKNIGHGGRWSKIEFCDVFDVENKNIIHVKKYSGSSVLSHLFAQGLVSAQLLLNDRDFKEKVEQKIAEEGGNHSFTDIEGYKIVFGIIAKPGNTDLPFFSKVNLNSTFTKIKHMSGYSPSITFIPNRTPSAENPSEDE